MKTLSGWGRYPKVQTTVAAPRDPAALAAALGAGTGIARGNGRAYGDSAVGVTTTYQMRHFDRMVSFDPDSGQLVAEAGVLLGDIIAAFLPRGWFPQVTPGTKFVTLGGMIAADVHGKNHHVDGSMRACVDWVDLMQADGQVIRCTPDQPLFDWTLGGMGLTGIILRAAIRLAPVESAYIAQQTQVAPDLDAAMAVFESADQPTYSVAWIDCLATGAAMGRSLIMTGEHAPAAAAPDPANPFATRPRRARRVPFDLPGLTLNRFSLRAFNALYWRAGQRKAGPSLVDWDSYFYPLDAVLGWNRIYGRKGFVQFQCVLPDAAAKPGLHALLAATASAGCGAFLSVLKRFGPQEGAFSFPMPGYTLALDFPVSARVLALMDRLDAITLDHGGRFYLAKDARLDPQTLQAADPRSKDFSALRQSQGMAARFRSAQSERLGL